MKFRSSAALLFLVVIFLLTPILPGFSTPTHPAASFGTVNQPSELTVWFDSPQTISFNSLQTISSEPCVYLFVVYAKTSSDLWITNLHWNFGDGSTLDVSSSAWSFISDTRSHLYQSMGNFTVTVTAYDIAGNSGTATVTLTDIVPGSCRADHGTTDGSPILTNAMVQNQATSLQLPSGGQIYLYGFVTGGGASSSQFSNGTYASVSNADGNLGDLAVTTSNMNYYTTQTSNYAIGGAGVSGFSSFTGSYGNDSTPGSSGTSDHFKVSTSGSLVVVFALGGDEQCLSVSGLPGFTIDATNINSPGLPNVITIGHAYLNAGYYTVSEQTQQCAAGQDPNHAGNLIGVFVFQPAQGTTTRPGLERLRPQS